MYVDLAVADQSGGEIQLRQIVEIAYLLIQDRQLNPPPTTETAMRLKDIIFRLLLLLFCFRRGQKL
jgi:hypothetical protein